MGKWIEKMVRFCWERVNKGKVALARCHRVKERAVLQRGEGALRHWSHQVKLRVDWLGTSRDLSYHSSLTFGYPTWLCLGSRGCSSTSSLPAINRSVFPSQTDIVDSTCTSPVASSLTRIFLHPHMLPVGARVTAALRYMLNYGTTVHEEHDFTPHPRV